MGKYFKVIITTIVISILLLNVCFAAKADSAAGKVVTQSTALNVRSGPGTGNAIIGKLNKGNYVTLLDESNGWWRVEYEEGKTGYVSSDYIEKLNDSKAYYVDTESTPLNIRSGPGTSYYIAGKLDKGEFVVVLSINNGWARVIYDGVKTGYVSSTYLALNNKYTAISLKVNRYAQADSRWGRIKLGSYGETIETIGCLTSAIAMSESYRTGTAITPDIIAKNSTYTASGAIYWPVNYINSYTQDYLKVIYGLLSEGKPVLIGAKTIYGGQHWVVVTGYSGGDSLKVSSFTIVDSGRANRATLSQFFSDYPVYYKIAYYK